ncbi:MAG: hypothetical protein KDH94_01015, partial [Coxiellaceae bacterium]|nr:hypothetical protein [Coxiellaceae bacterium]
MSRDASPRTEVTEQQNPQAFAEVLEALVHYYEVVKQPEEERLASPSISDHVYAKAHYFVENDVSFNGYSLIFFQLVLDLNEIYLATKKHKTLLEDLLMLQADVDSKAQTLADFESKIATLEYEKEQVNFGYNNALAPVEPLEAEVSQLSAEKLEKEKAVAQV